MSNFTKPVTHDLKNCGNVSNKEVGHIFDTNSITCCLFARIWIGGTKTLTFQRSDGERGRHNLILGETLTWGIINMIDITLWKIELLHKYFLYINETILFSFYILEYKKLLCHFCLVKNKTCFVLKTFLYTFLHWQPLI